MTAIASVPNAVIFDQWGPVPVYHVMRPWEGVRVTRCGLGLDPPGRLRPIVLRRDHAEKFARRCKRCGR